MPSVLVVDDDPDLVEAIAIVLGEAGFEVVSAASHEAALGLARAHRPVVALVDLHLPGVDAATLIRALRRELSTTIALCTGADVTEDSARATGADVLLRKPFSIDALLALAHHDARPPAPRHG